MRNMMLAVILLISSTLPMPAFAALNVVATLPWIGSLAREIGRDRISVTTLVKPSQDPHFLDAKPSMILAARKANILIYNGLDLEIAYLPLVIEQSKNRRIMPGMPGNLDCSKFVRVMEKFNAVDRSMGDQHPLGNPHYHYSPANILPVAEGIAKTLAGLDRVNAEFYRSNLKSFAAKLDERQKQWKAVPLKGKRFVAYHKLFEYLATEYGFQLVGYVEAKPGIPPSAGHVKTLIEGMKASRPDGILTTSLYGAKEAQSISEKTGVRVINLPADVGNLRGTDDYISFMDRVMAALR